MVGQELFRVPSSIDLFGGEKKKKKKSWCNYEYIIVIITTELSHWQVVCLSV